MKRGTLSRLGAARAVSLVVAAGLAVAAVAAPLPPASGPDLAVPLKERDIDFPACKAWIDGEEAQGDFKAGILATLGLAPGTPWTAIHSSLQHEAKVIEYLVVLKKPVKFGSVLFQQQGSLQYLKPGAALPADPAQAASWVDVSFPPHQSGWRLATVEGETQAFLCTVKNHRHGWDSFTLLRLMKPRLSNIVPAGIANGEAEYTSYGDLRPPAYFKASFIVSGEGTWQSHGPDTTGRTPRPPVTDIDPTWFVVSWDEPQTISGLLLAANFTSFKVYTYRGPPGINPAVAGPQDWARIKQEPRKEAGGVLVTFPPVSTRGVKFVAEATTAGERWGRVSGLHVFTDLGDMPVPQRIVASDTPPLAIDLTLPEKGIVSLAVDGPDGRRVRNFPARLEMKAGEHAVGWDLKDESGAHVAPGSYTWKAITHPGLEIKYEMSPYPNVEMVTKDNSPWLNGASGPGGWLADHSPPRAVCAAGDGRVFLSSQCCESGVAVIECDLEGRKHWGHGNIIAWTGPAFLASDGTEVVCMPEGTPTDHVWRFSLPDKKLDTSFNLDATATRKRGARGLAVRDGKLYIAVNAGASSLENAFSTSLVDQDNCEPKYPKPTNSTDANWDSLPRDDFLRL